MLWIEFLLVRVGAVLRQGFAQAGRTQVSFYILPLLTCPYLTIIKQASEPHGRLHANLILPHMAVFILQNFPPKDPRAAHPQYPLNKAALSPVMLCRLNTPNSA